MIEWTIKIWHNTARVRPGPKLLLLDSYPLHKEFQHLLSEHDTHVLYVPAGLTFALQPLDQGFFKTFKDHLRRNWIENQGRGPTSEKEKRLKISTDIKTVWLKLADYDHTGYWRKARLGYPLEDVEFRRRRNEQMMIEEEILNEAQGDNGGMQLE